MKPVKKLNDNDVLFGRGEVACQYIGNRRFRDDICEQYKATYNAATSGKKRR
jgi:hypothetical protein